MNIQHRVEQALQSLQLPVPRNPAEGYIFQNAPVAGMLESVDGTVEYFDAGGELVAVLDANGNAYLLDGDAWRFVSIDEIIDEMAAATIVREEEGDAQCELPDAEELVCRAPASREPEPAEPIAASSPFELPMSIAPEDRYCDPAEMVCRMPEIDEGGQTERAAQRFAEEAPTPPASRSPKKRSQSDGARGGAAEPEASEPTPQAQAHAEKSDESTTIETIDFDEAGEGGAAVADADELSDLPEEIGAQAADDPSAADEAAGAMPTPMAEQTSAPIDPAAAMIEPSVVHAMAREYGASILETSAPDARDATAVVGPHESAGAATAIPLGGMSVFGPFDEGGASADGTQLPVEARSTAGALFMIEERRGDPGESDAIDGRRDGAARLQRDVTQESSQRRPVLRRSFRDLKRSGKRTSLLDDLFGERTPAEFDPFADMNATAALGGMPHTMAAIPGTVALADAAEKGLKLEVEAAHGRGDPNDHQQDDERRDSDDDAWATVEELPFEEEPSAQV